MVLLVTGVYSHWEQVLRVSTGWHSALSRTQRGGVLGSLCRIPDDGGRGRESAQSDSWKRESHVIHILQAMLGVIRALATDRLRGMP